MGAGGGSAAFSIPAVSLDSGPRGGQVGGVDEMPF